MIENCLLIIIHYRSWDRCR